MERTGITKIECAYFSISIRENPPKAVIDDVGKLPRNFFRPGEPPLPEPDKKAIVDAFKSGEEVPGAHIERTKRLDIK